MGGGRGGGRGGFSAGGGPASGGFGNFSDGGPNAGPFGNSVDRQGGFGMGTPAYGPDGGWSFQQIVEKDWELEYISVQLLLIMIIVGHIFNTVLYFSHY